MSHDLQLITATQVRFRNQETPIGGGDNGRCVHLAANLLFVKSMYGGLEVCEAKRLKAREENRTLKKLLAEEVMKT